ncbi:MAG: hypothetical protein P8X79_00085 [Reinekea sp.]
MGFGLNPPLSKTVIERFLFFPAFSVRMSSQNLISIFMTLVHKS